MANYVSNVTIPDPDPNVDTTYTYDVKEAFPHIGTCSTAAATGTKSVTLAGFTLYTGAWLIVKFDYANTADVSTVKLDVNGTGAKSVKYRNANLGWAGQLIANRYTMFIYDGTYYQVVMDFDSNNYDRTSVQTKIYAGTAGVFNYALCALDNNQRMQSFTTTAGTGTSKAFNTSASFMYPPVIMLHYENATRANGTVITNNVLYEQFPQVDLRYSCNITSSAGFAQYKPVYLECEINSDGTFKLTTNGLTQTFTSGKYYILLGCMYSTSVYQLALFAQHPMFYYDGTNLNGIVYTAAEKTKLAGITEGATKVEASSTNGKIKINGTDTTVYTHPTKTQSDTTSTASPSHGGTFTAVDSVTRDSEGHVSGINVKTVTLPADNDTKNTAGATDTSSKIFLIGATAQTANPQTYSDNEVFATSGVLTTKKTQVGGGACTLEYNTTTESLDFVFT